LDKAMRAMLLFSEKHRPRSEEVASHQAM